jgi:hypothetical protein
MNKQKPKVRAEHQSAVADSNHQHSNLTTVVKCHGNPVFRAPTEPNENENLDNFGLKNNDRPESELSDTSRDHTKNPKQNV